MSDQSDKPKLGTRPPLGVKRTVETGKVKQSFSHGRSNTVVVEVKKRRILGKPGEAAPVAEAPAPVAAPAPAPARPAPAPTPPPAQRRPADDISSRRELQERLLREAEEARMAALEQARRRDDRAKIDQTEEEKRRAEENRKAEEAAAAEAARIAALPPAPEPEAPATEPETSAAPGDDRVYRKPGPVQVVKRPDPVRPARGRDGRRPPPLGQAHRYQGADRRGRQPHPQPRCASSRSREGKACPRARRGPRPSRFATSSFRKRSRSRSSPTAWRSVARTW